MSKKANSDRLKLYLGLEERIILPELADNALENNVPLEDSTSSGNIVPIEDPNFLEDSTSSGNIVPIENPNLIEDINLAENIITSEDSLPIENTNSVDNTVPLDQLVNTENIQEGDFNQDSNIKKFRGITISLF